MSMFLGMYRYPFAAAFIEGAPDEAGVYVLWEGNEVTYIGTAGPGAMTIRSRLVEHIRGQHHCSCNPTHYSWRLARFPQVAERELLSLHKLHFQDVPRCNRASA